MFKTISLQIKKILTLTALIVCKLINKITFVQIYLKNEYLAQELRNLEFI